MRYFATASGPKVRKAMAAGLLGQIITPRSRNRLEPGAAWCVDNAIFGGAYPGDERYLRWLAGRSGDAATCAFAVAPDVVCDAAATLERSAPMLPRIRALGYPVALVAQNGLECLAVPWDSFDVLFIGGDDAWKEGLSAWALTAEAKARGKQVHMGRVNTRRRMQLAQRMGCDSVDGTTIARGPDIKLRSVLAWQRELDWPALFPITEEGAA